MARREICTLSKTKAIEAIKGTTTVFYRSGVWNNYVKTKTKDAIENIQDSGYGADVYEENGNFYVSCPCSSDMW